MRGDRLRKLREAAALSQEELAIRTQSSEPQIWRYENDPKTKPREDAIIRLAEFFNVSADYLIGLSDDPHVNVRDLSDRERAAIDAWRRGERIEAIKAIVGDE